VNFSAGNCTSGLRNIVYVATENNSVYAIDADTYAVCKQVSLNNSGETAIPVTALPAACDNISGSTTYGTVGITSTPVIDPANNILFVVSAHQVGTAPPYSYTQRLNALDATTLSPLGPALDLPTIINNHKPSGYPTFYALNENQRSGLLLATSSTTANIYVAWGSFCDSSITSGGYFGLAAEFDYSYATKSLDTSHVEAFYPMGTSAASGGKGGGGIWMSGGAPAADSGGNVYVAVGNGNFEGVTSPLNYGESIVKLGNPLTVEDYYTPNVWSKLNSGTTGPVGCAGYPTICQIPSLAGGDWDLGSGGVVILTRSSGSTYGKLVAGGKEGIFYVTYYCSSSTCPASTWNQLMGGLDGGGYGTNTHSDETNYACTPATTPTNGDVAQCFYGVPVTTRAESGERATPAYWAPAGATPYLYTVGTTDVLKAYQFVSGTFTTPAGASGSTTYPYPGATPSISWDGSHTTTAIVWVLDTHAWKSTTNNRAVLSAYAAVPNGTSLTRLWVDPNPTANAPGATKFMVPTIANGKIYIGGQQASGCGSTCTGLLAIYHQ
jgi:hypothetical protein